jgi:hypothetical protein
MPPDVRRGKAFGAQSSQITAQVSPKCFAQPPRETRAISPQIIRAGFPGSPRAKHAAANLAVGDADCLPNALPLQWLNH